MRTINARASAGLLAVLAASGGCKWTDFDDLKEDTWVTSTGKPDNDSANWAVAIARVARTGSGGTLAVLGASEALYNDLVIGPNGDTNTTSESELNRQFSVGNLAVEPLFLSNPEADEVALVTALEANRIAVVRASGGQNVAFGVTGLAQPSGATFMTSPPRPMDGPTPQTQILVAQNELVFGAFFDQSKAPNPQTKCTLVDAANMPVNVRALGAYRPTEAATTDDVLVLSDNGRLIAYPGSVFNGCGAGGAGGNQAPKAGMVLDLGFTSVQTGSQILTFEDGAMVYALVQMHSDSNRGRLALFRINAASIEEVGSGRDIERLKTAALFQPTGDPKRYVIAGAPAAFVDGVEAGQVQVIEISTTSGIAATLMTLFDAQPEDGQAFGRGVAELPYNNKKIIAVAADNDVYLYFRTSMYGETREGR